VDDSLSVTVIAVYFTISPSAPPVGNLVSGVTCLPASLGQGALSTCTVTLTAPAPTGGTAVALASDNALLAVPASVVVAVGATTAPFSGTAAVSIATYQSATVTATLGVSSQFATISLLVPVLPVLVSGVACLPASLGQGAVSTCTVTLTAPAPIGGTAVALASNNASLIVPASVVAIMGATTAPFSATAAASIATDQSATVTATLGASFQFATISLLMPVPPVLVSGVACLPARLGQGAVSMCAVTLTQPAPTGGTAVALASNNASLTVPASVAVAMGATTAPFSATAAASIATNQSATVTATLGGRSQIATISLTTVGGSGGGGGGGGSGGGGSSEALMASPATVTLVVQANTSGTQTVTLTYQTPWNGGPPFLAAPVTNDNLPWLTVSPTSGTMTQASFDGTTFTYTATVTLALDPSRFAPGYNLSGAVNYSVTSSGSTSTASTAVTMNVVGGSNLLTVSPTSLSFSYTQGASSLPVAQSISVFTQPSAATFTASAPSENWLSVGAGGTTPGSVPVLVNVAGLAVGTFTGTVTISTSATSSVNLPVTLAVLAPAPHLSASPLNEQFSVVLGSSPATGQLTVSNTGGGTLQFSAQAVSNQGTWLTLTGSASGQATLSAPGSIDFTTDPSGLAPGLYTGQINVQDENSTAHAVVNITLGVSQADQMFTLSQSALTYSAIGGGQMPPAQSFTVSNQGNESLSWTAQAQTLSNPLAPLANWLSISPAGGTSIVGQTGAPVEVFVTPLGLPAGQYYGSVTIRAPDAAIGPQSVLVLLNVTAVGDIGTSVRFSTGGVILSGPAGSTTPQMQQITFFNLSNKTMNYSATVSTSNGVRWLTVSPASGQALLGNTAILIEASLSALSPGVNTGTVSVGFDDGTVGVVQVVVVATGG
jgi:hypothetical protein